MKRTVIHVTKDDLKNYANASHGGAKKPAKEKLKELHKNKTLIYRETWRN